MHIPKLYREEDRKTILQFLQRNNFPALVSYDGEKPLATHTPVEVVEQPDGSWVIYTHLSRANPQWKTFNGQEVLLIFQGAHTYISARWYNHINVPTWNYMMIHVYGKIRILEDQEFYNLLSRLVAQHEARSEYRLESLPQDFVKKEMNGAVGFAIEVTKVDAGYKLSQNRNDEDHANIIRELEKREDNDSHEIAKAMKLRRAQKIGEQNPPPNR